jgi:hypothetical protein
LAKKNGNLVENGNSECTEEISGSHEKKDFPITSEQKGKSNSEAEDKSELKSEFCSKLNPEQIKTQKQKFSIHYIKADPVPSIPDIRECPPPGTIYPRSRSGGGPGDIGVGTRTASGTETGVGPGVGTGSVCGSGTVSGCGAGAGVGTGCGSVMTCSDKICMYNAIGKLP